MRTEAAWKKLEEAGEDLCKAVGIRTETQRPGRQRSAPRHLDEFIITSSTGQRDGATPPDAGRKTFYANTDRMFNELTRQFSSNACNVLMGATALNPKHTSFLDKEALSGMAANYEVAEDDLAVDVHQLKRLIARKRDKGQEVSTPLELAAIWSHTRTPSWICINLSALQ